MTKQHYSNSDHRRRQFGVTCVALLGLVLAACTGGGTPPLQTTPTTDAPAVTTSETLAPTEADSTTATTQVEATEPSTSETSASDHPLDSIDADFAGALLGVTTELNTKDRAPRFRQLEADAGRQYDIGHVFHAWDKPIPTVDDLMHLEDGRILMISWNGTDTREIAAGVHDDWIRTQAQAVRDLEEPLLLRWLWEMDGRRKIEQVYSGPDYVAAWKHVRGIFDEVGADNAQFVWCPNEFLFWDGGDPTPWYPGDEHVDWLCADGYNWATSSTDAEWITIDKIFEDFVAWAAPRNKPIILGETGSNEGEAGAKAEWLRSVPRLLEQNLPEVDAVVYFDKDFTGFGFPDWRVDTNEDSYQGWIDMSNDPYFNQLTSGS